LSGGLVLDKERFVSQIDACSVTMYRMAWTILRNDADGNILPKGMNLTTPLKRIPGNGRHQLNSALKFFWESIPEKMKLVCGKNNYRTKLMFSFFGKYLNHFQIISEPEKKDQYLTCISNLFLRSL